MRLSQLSVLLPVFALSPSIGGAQEINMSYKIQEIETRSPNSKPTDYHFYMKSNNPSTVIGPETRASSVSILSQGGQNGGGNVDLSKNNTVRDITAITRGPSHLQASAGKSLYANNIGLSKNIQRVTQGYIGNGSRR